MPETTLLSPTYFAIKYIQRGIDAKSVRADKFPRAVVEQKFVRLHAPIRQIRQRKG